MKNVCNPGGPKIITWINHQKHRTDYIQKVIKENVFKVEVPYSTWGQIIMFSF